jgi:hypothetical protein
MTTTTGTQEKLGFAITSRHAGLKLLVIGGLYAALALGFVASVEQTARRSVVQATEASTQRPASTPAGTVALR